MAKNNEVAHEDFENLFVDSGGVGPDGGQEPIEAKRQRRPRGRAAKQQNVTKQTVRDAIAFANMAAAFAYPKDALTEHEIDALAEAWFQVIKEHPSVGKYLVVGKQLGTWGNLLFVHFTIFAPRVTKIANSIGTGTARSSSGNDRQRKDNTHGAAS